MFFQIDPKDRTVTQIPSLPDDVTALPHNHRYRVYQSDGSNNRPFTLGGYRTKLFGVTYVEVLEFVKPNEFGLRVQFINA